MQTSSLYPGSSCMFRRSGSKQERRLPIMLSTGHVPHGALQTLTKSASVGAIVSQPHEHGFMNKLPFFLHQRLTQGHYTRACHCQPSSWLLSIRRRAVMGRGTSGSSCARGLRYLFDDLSRERGETHL